MARPPELVEVFFPRLPRETGDIVATVDATRRCPAGPRIADMRRAASRPAAAPHPGSTARSRTVTRRRWGALAAPRATRSTAPQKRSSTSNAVAGRQRVLERLTWEICRSPRRRAEVVLRGRSTWSGSWNEFVPRIIPRGRQTGHSARSLKVIIAGQAWCPRQDSNLRSRLRRPVDLVIAGRLLASYLGFLFASCVSGGLPCAVVRSTRHSTATVLIGRIETLMFGEASVVRCCPEGPARGGGGR